VEELGCLNVWAESDPREGKHSGVNDRFRDRDRRCSRPWRYGKMQGRKEKAFKTSEGKESASELGYHSQKEKQIVARPGWTGSAENKPTLPKYDQPDKHQPPKKAETREKKRRSQRGCLYEPRGLRRQVYLIRRKEAPSAAYSVKEKNKNVRGDFVMNDGKECNPNGPQQQGRESGMGSPSNRGRRQGHLSETPLGKSILKDQTLRN